MRGTELSDAITVTSERLAEAILRLLAHDLRAPLGPLTLATSALEDDPALTADQRTLACMAGAQAQRMGRLIDAVLAGVRGPRVPVTVATELAALLEDVLARYRALGGDGVLAPSDARASVDPELMRDALLNLVEVAGDGTGRVDIAVHPEPGGIRISLIGSDPDGCAVGLTAEHPRDWRAALALGAAATVRAHRGVVVATPRGADVIVEAS